MSLLTIQEASELASLYTKRNITTSNISYLVQYGRVKKIGENGNTRILKDDLINYYKSVIKTDSWKKKLGDDLNWHLSFEEYKEYETTKHVHRLHPYKGKFIPQLVEYFLDSHTDEFKRDVFFNKGDIILDPFCGSGTTLVQSNELGMHAVGIDISSFNALISNIKLGQYNFLELNRILGKISIKLEEFIKGSNIAAFENDLLQELKEFNNEFFPSPDFKYRLGRGLLDEEAYSLNKEKSFLPIFNRLIKKHQIPITHDKKSNFIDHWYLPPVQHEIAFFFNLLKKISDQKIREVIYIIFSRTIRSCRATTHSDLATLKEPVRTTYYCRKHKKICKPLFSILSWWLRYSSDTVSRLEEFERLKTNTLQICLTGDSRNIDLYHEIKIKNIDLYHLLKNQKISGIFSSPPYVGLIDYHEQHAYAYDLFGFKRNDALEIGPLFKGQGMSARESYIQGISGVLIHGIQYLKNDFNVFLVSNDKWNLYPRIADNAGLKVVNQYKRPVLNRTERDKGAYSETIFHMKAK